MQIELVGSAPARALVVPGSDLCGAFYRPLGRELARLGCSTGLVTLPGSGHSPPLQAPTFDAFIDLLNTALDHSSVLIGHSLGGLLALLCAARRPPGLTHLVLLEPSVFPSRLFARLAGRRYLEEVVHTDRERFVNHNGLSRRANLVEAYPPEMIELYLKTRRSSDARTTAALFQTMPALYPLPYRDVKVPVLLVTGRQSGAAARLMRVPLVRALRPRHEVLFGAAHWLVNEDDPALASIIHRFLEETQGGAR